MPRSSAHVDGLDGLRAVAALAVVATHVAFVTGQVRPGMAGALLARLDVGVALFFALSGFLLARPWLRASLLHETRGTSLGRYALHRAARILPAYWLVLAAVLVVQSSGMLSSSLQDGLAVSPGVVATHVVVGQAWTGDFFPTFSQTWSLTTELTFYAVLPALGVALVRLNREVEDPAHRFRRFSRACLLAAVIGLAVTAWCATSLPGGGDVLRSSVLGHLAWFAAGVWVAGARLTGRGLPSVAARPDELAAGAAVLLVVAASPLGGGLLFSSPSVPQAVLRELAYALVAGLGVLAASSRGPSSRTMRVLESPALRWVGERSYGLFLWHLVVLFVVMTMLRAELFTGSFVVVGSVTLALSLLLAHLTWTVVEAPAQRWAHGRTALTREQAEREKPERLRDH